MDSEDGDNSSGAPISQRPGENTFTLSSISVVNSSQQLHNTLQLELNKRVYFYSNSTTHN